MYRKNIFRILFAVVVLALFMGYAAQQQAHAAIQAVDLNPKIASGQLVQKVETFMVIFDATFSMNDIYKNNTKLNRQKSLIALFDDTIPNLKLTGALRIFGQLWSFWDNMTFGDASSKTAFWAMGYSKPALTKAVAPYTTGQGFSPLDVALDGATADLRSQSGRMAVIVFSDGEDMEKYAPIASAKRMKSAYGNRICIYTVHLGDNTGGKKLMQQVADEGQCGFMVTGDSISTPAGMADFVERVFLEAKREEPVKKPVAPPVVEQEIKVLRETAPVVSPAPKAEPAPEKVSIALNVQFDTGKANIKPKYHQEIKKVADFMAKYPKASAVIEGHTDNVGKEAANVKLSQRRADSIKEYLVKKFKIDGSRIKAVGYGPNKPIASNATKEGRQKNRRVDAVFSHDVK
jgi:OOP family OmpA-OmpF porin